MDVNKRRLQNIEESLTPKESFLLWMQEALAFDSMCKYAQFVADLPEHAWPMHRLADQVRKNARTGLRGQDKQVEATVSQSLQELLFLNGIFLTTNSMIEEMCTQNSTKLSLLLLQTLQDEHAPALLVCVVTGRHACRFPWVIKFRELIEDVCATRDAVEQISSKYFNGHRLVWNSTNEKLNALIGLLESLAETHNELVKGAKALRSESCGSGDEGNEDVHACEHFSIDWEKIRKSIQPQVARKIGRLVDCAKAGMLAAVGQHASAMNLLRRHLK